MEREPSAWRTVEAAVAAGAVATAAMSVFMKVWQSVSPLEQARPIPPRSVTKGITETVGIWQRLPPAARTALTWASHFGYGTTMAVVYAESGGRASVPPAASGSVFGLGVWAASYAGWLPALGILPPPKDKPRERNAMLVGAHLVWGSVLGLVFFGFRPKAHAGPRTSVGGRVPSPPFEGAVSLPNHEPAALPSTGSHQK
jgi:uncharacterized membrane protein YagU involved in acid resistance